MSYLILRSDDLDELTAHVDAKIRAGGWVPTGGVAVQNFGETVYYFQAMMRI
jgi:hypothetical protein